MKLKIALCVPAYGHVHAKWTQCLANMITHTLGAKLIGGDGEPLEVELETFMVSSSMLCESRHRLCAEASLWGADYMLFMDADHVFPADILCRLWARNADIVGVNYSRRCEPTAPTACKKVTTDPDRDIENLVYTTQAKADAGEVEEVDHLGFGLCLIRMSVFDRLQDQAEKEGRKSFMPLFVFELKDDGMSMIGEDVYFFRKCREAGVKVLLDHAASWEVGHLHEMIMTNAHAVVQKDDWVEQGRAFVKRLNEKAEELENA